MWGKSEERRKQLVHAKWFVCFFPLIKASPWVSHGNLSLFWYEGNVGICISAWYSPQLFVFFSDLYTCRSYLSCSINKQCHTGRYF